ncbi:hypothetical protein BDC45DRAFT_557052 [Circinella umbellata]|nr:hypothetical protein BDC45DRAFT_557052 [Circinella umbellata]
MFWSVEDENRIVELKENNPRTTWEEISQDIDERHNAMACRKRFLGTLPMELNVKMTLAQRRLVCKMLSREQHPASYEEVSKALLPDIYKPEAIKHFYDLIATDKEVARGYRDAQGEASKVGSRLKDLPPSGLTTTGTTSSSVPTPADGAGTTAPSSLTSKRPARTIPTRTVMRASGNEKRGLGKYARQNPRYWTEEEENTLLEMYSENKPWQEISDTIGGRSVAACQGKFRRMDVDAVIDAKRKREETIISSKEEPTSKKLKTNQEGDSSQEKHSQSQAATGPVTRHKARLSKSEKQ